MTLQLMTDFFLFILIGTGMAFFQIYVLRRDFPGKMLPPLIVSFIGAFCGSLLGSLLLNRLDANSLLVLSLSSLFLSALFLQIFYMLSRMKDNY